jgi:hypothetical protein
MSFRPDAAKFFSVRVSRCSSELAAVAPLLVIAGARFFVNRWSFRPGSSAVPKAEEHKFRLPHAISAGTGGAEE